MKYLFLLGCSCLLISACRNRDRVPKDILSREKMQAIMWDMMRADQFLGDYVFNNDSTLVKKDESTRLYREILALHQVTQDEFRDSYYYYRAHPGLLKELMDSISRPHSPSQALDTTRPRLIADTVSTTKEEADRPVSPPKTIPLD